MQVVVDEYHDDDDLLTVTVVCTCDVRPLDIYSDHVGGIRLLAAGSALVRLSGVIRTGESEEADSPELESLAS